MDSHQTMQRYASWCNWMRSNVSGCLRMRWDALWMKSGLASERINTHFVCIPTHVVIVRMLQNALRNHARKWKQMLVKCTRSECASKEFWKMYHMHPDSARCLWCSACIVMRCGWCYVVECVWMLSIQKNVPGCVEQMNANAMRLFVHLCKKMLYDV